MTIAHPQPALCRVMILILALGVAGCSKVSTNITAPPDPGDTVFAPSLGIDLEQMNQSASGLWWLDTLLGTGAEAEEGQVVSVTLSGWLSDGTLFDSQTLEAILAPSFLIPGLLEGIIGMKVGGTRKLVVPPALAWGAVGNGPVPPNATVVFDLELLAIIE